MDEIWEYKIIHFSCARWTSTGLPSDVNERFDEFGKQGWELVATESIIRPTWFGATTVGIVGFFKRQLLGASSSAPSVQSATRTGNDERITE